MTQPPRHGMVTLLIAGACAALVVVAIFNGGIKTLKDSAVAEADDLAQSSYSPAWPSFFSPTVPAPAVVKRYACPRCSRPVTWGSDSCPRCGWSRLHLVNRAALPGTPSGGGRFRAPAGLPAAETEFNAARHEQPAWQAAAATPTASLPSPHEQDAAGKEFIEGHWLGLEVIPLAPELAADYKVPKGESGVLVDEITLEAAESGILAGDMVRSIEGCPTADLRAFFLATQHVQGQKQARVEVSRRGSKMTFVMAARNTKTLGFAQMEAAQPIQPGAISPHRSWDKACTHCHIIMRAGGQLPTDTGDLLPKPPPIRPGAKAPHGNRGECRACHVVK